MVRCGERICHSACCYWTYDTVLSLLNGSFSLSRLLSYVYYPAGGGLWYLWALFFIYVIHASIIRLNSTNLYYRFFVLLLTYIILLRLSALLDGHFGMYENQGIFLRTRI